MAWLEILVGVMRIANSNKIIDLLLQGIKAYVEYACQLSCLTHVCINLMLMD